MPWRRIPTAPSPRFARSATPTSSCCGRSICSAARRSRWPTPSRKKACARRPPTCRPTRFSSGGNAASRSPRSCHEYVFVPDFEDWTKKTLDDWREWADRFNAAGAVARKHGVWLGFHNESYHQKPIDGQVPYDVFISRLDPSVTRLQLDVGNMLIGGGDPMQYLQKYPDRFWSFHLKDAVADRSRDTGLGKGIFDFKRIG